MAQTTPSLAQTTTTPSRMFSLIQQLSKELAQSAFAVPNNVSAPAATGGPTGSTGSTEIPLNFQSILQNFQITDFISIWRFIASFSIARDWIKLFLLGSVLETIRRFAGSIWRTITDSFFLTATFESDDAAYNWMMIWISKQPAWRKARDIQISTKVRRLKENHDILGKHLRCSSRTGDLPFPIILQKGFLSPEKQKSDSINGL